jgi:phage/plasmid-like protein (TIGR03299 family)
MMDQKPGEPSTPDKRWTKEPKKMKNTRWSLNTGKDVSAVVSSEALEKAGLNFSVLQSPMYFDNGNGMTLHDGGRINFRSDTRDVLGVVSDTYKVLQNKDAFRFLDSLIGVAEAMYVNAGSFKNGAKVYIQAKLPGEIRFDDGGEDVGEKYLTFVTSHDGSLPVSVMFSPIRIICQNTLLMALRENVRKTSVRHTLNMAMSLEGARNTLGILNNQFSLLEDLSRKMSKMPFDSRNIGQLVMKTGMIPNESEQSTRAKNIIEEVLQKFHYGQGSNLKSAKGTAWGAYNAVVEYVDHFRGSDSVKRAESSMLGSGAMVKEKALSLLASI